MKTSYSTVGTVGYRTPVTPYAMGAALLLLGMAITLSPTGQASEPNDSDGTSAWAYDPFGSALFNTGTNDDSARLSSVGVQAIGASTSGKASVAANSSSDQARELPADTRFSAGNLNELWGESVASQSLTEDKPMFESSGSVDQPPAVAPVELASGNTTSKYAGSTRLTSRVSEFDGSAGDLFKVYMRPVPEKVVSGKAKPMTSLDRGTLEQPVLSHVKTDKEPSPIQASALPSMPNHAHNNGTSLTSKVTTVERLSISANMLRNVR
ncbi:MAG: hypothetical protein H6981_05340 [Gammaproteobacteria bacterium]|nr:hypothetical protein [Gammaproteobacteria bacterium]MCP5136206.1 hypothetical protein [Gammaproteobacteria bacterium]